jgi:hypothetical protein
VTSTNKAFSAVITTAAMLLPIAGQATTVHATAADSDGKNVVRVLSDHPGAATALTAKQKSEIRAVLARGEGNQSFVCTGASLAGQRESMYRVVRLRAQLVCDFAKSVDPSLNTSVQERITKARQFNGRVVVVSK